MLTGVGCEGREMVVLCVPEAAEPRTVSPEVETLLGPKAATASGRGEIIEGTQALHFVCSTRHRATKHVCLKQLFHNSFWLFETI